MHGGVEETEQLYRQISEISQEQQNLWVEHVLFTWQWWVGIALTIIPWFLWGIFRKKESTLRLLTVGFFIMFIASWLDLMGVQLGLWYYQYAVIPFIPALFPWNTSLLPVFIMVLLEIKNIPLSIKALGFGVFTAFIVEPFFIWIRFYDPVNWKHVYSFLIYVVLFLISHYLCYRNSYQEP